MSDLKKQSNPFSTGGGGVNFETRVQASFAVSLLTESYVPCLSQDMRVEELRFQNKFNGSNTDDLIIIASGKNFKKNKILAQIKHEITVSESEESIFSEVINSAWADFKNPGFDLHGDVIALITGPIPKNDVNNTLPILEWAKYSSTASEFIKKSNSKGFTSEAKKKRLEIFRQQLVIASGGVVSDDELWGFLKIFHWISYDLDSQSSVVASLLGSLIQSCSDELPHLVLAKIITCVQEFNQNAGTLTLGNIPNDVSSLFVRSANSAIEDDIRKLRERGEHVLLGISNSVKGLHVDRNDQLAAITNSYRGGGFLFVTGARGVGKSGIVKDFILTRAKDVPVFYLRAEDLDKSHLNDVFSSFGMNSTLREIAGKFSLLKEKILVIESAEKILELAHQNAFVDLLQYIKLQEGWTVIATGRDYAYQQLVINYVQPSGIPFGSVNIEGFSKDQLAEVCKVVPGLKDLVTNDSLNELLRIPFLIDLAVRAIDSGAHFTSGDTEADFRNIVWATVIEKSIDRRLGMPAKRRAAFIAIALQRARNMVFGIRDTGFEPDVVSKLEEDNVIFRDQRSKLISLSHDVLEDWALEEYIDGEYLDCVGDPRKFLNAIGNEPAINRAFRLWLNTKLKANQDVSDFLEKILISDQIEAYWKDEAISAILQSPDPKNIFLLLKSHLLKDNNSLLIRFFFILRITCQRPVFFENEAAKDFKSGLLLVLNLRPYGSGWDELIKFTYEMRSELVGQTFVQVVEILDEWSALININDDLPEIAEIVGLLGLYLLDGIKDDYDENKKRKKILSVILKVSPNISDQFDILMNREVFIPKNGERRARFVDELSNLALIGLGVPMLCKRRPEFVIRLAKHEWLRQEEDEGEDPFLRYRRMDVEESYGLDSGRDFFPASGAKGPFKYLLNFHPRLALDFIIELCNKTAIKYAESEFASPPQDNSGFDFSTEVTVKKIEIPLNDGMIISQYASPHLWKGYRSTSTLPYLLQCALMALENWLVIYVKVAEVNDIAWAFDYILRNSNSVMPTAVLASVATGFPLKVGRASFPILKCPELYKLDLERSVRESGANELNWFAAGMNRDLMAEIYVEERRTAALRPWRKESIEILLIKLQTDSALREEALKVLDGLIFMASNSNMQELRFLVHRADTRNMKAVVDEKNNRIIFQTENELPEDLKSIQSEFNAQHGHDNAIQKLFLWSKKAYSDKVVNEEYYPDFNGAIDAAKILWSNLQENKVKNFVEMAFGAVATTAAVCIRDFLPNLSNDVLTWCVGIVFEFSSLGADELDSIYSHDATDQFGSAACAFALSRLFSLELDDEDIKSLKYALATALTHVNLHVCASAAMGVREFLWGIRPDVAHDMLSGIVEYARFRKNEIKSRRFNYLESSAREEKTKEWNSIISNFRSDLISGCFELIVDDVSPATHSSWFFHLICLVIPFENIEKNQILLLKKIVEFVYEDEYVRHRSDQDEKINHDIKKQIQDCLVEHTIRSHTSGFEPIADLLIQGCSKAPSFIYLLKLQFDVAMEKIANFNAIWDLWSLLEPELHIISLNDVDDRYSGRQNDLTEFLRGMLYLGSRWNGHPSERKVMEIGARRLLNFSSNSGSNSNVFEALSSLMYHFYDIFFEEGIHILSGKYAENPKLIARRVNTAFYLEMSLGRYLQKENRGALSKKMHEACLCLLNGVVETGSARAYYLRENLIRSRRISI
jgi:hypothetical protein